MLADYAVHVEESRGRRFPEPPHPYRDDFQRDRDRVVHSRAFRRLENKTQVFTGRRSDHFRTRLTHTIEVAQISRTIAAQLGLNEDLVEALALVHDIGHPPFGHAGEKALDGAMREHGLFFDHNLHALRIVEDFELRYAAFRGLNLTFEVREGIIKHSHDWKQAEFPQLGEYLLEQRPPLEAQLIDWTDEIAYTTADMDDGYEARLLAVAQLRAGIPIFEEHFAAAERRYPRAPEKMRFNEAIKGMLNALVTDLISTTRENVRAAGVRTLEEVRCSPARLVALGAAADARRRAAKDFLYRNLYFSEALVPDKQQAERVIRELFAYWIERPSELPPAYQEKLRAEPPARIVCDYIAGMTDNFILKLHRKLIGRVAAGR